MKWLFLLAALLLSACNLNSRDVEQQALSTIVSQTVITPTTAEIGRDEAPTETAAPTQAAAQSAAQPVISGGEAPAESVGASGGGTTSGGGGYWRPVCTPRYDWPVYVVQPGDTLNRIARRASTTATVLASANCLANPNLIAVGQRLRVPFYLPPVTQPPPPPPGIHYVTSARSTSHLSCATTVKGCCSRRGAMSRCAGRLACRR